jgi:hypothetical protein
MRCRSERNDALSVRTYLAKHPEIVAEDFPGYAPELNPDEQVWNWTKNGPLANRPTMPTGYSII